MEPRNPLTLAIAALISLALFSVFSSLAVAQPTAEEARSTFEKLGCVSCHNGAIAPAWDEMVSLVREWGQKYPSLDEAVREESRVREGFRNFGYQFDSWDEMMSQMARNVGKSPDDPDFFLVNQFLLSLVGVQPTTPTETITPTTPEETPPQVREAEEPFAGVVLTALIIALIVIGAGVAAVILMRR